MNERVFGFHCHLCLSIVLCLVLDNSFISSAQDIQLLYREGQRTLAKARAQQLRGTPSETLWRELIVSAEQILAINPRHSEANAWVAESYETLGLQTQAWRSWQQTWLETNDPTALQKSIILGHQLADASLAAGLVDAAEKYYLAMFELDPSDLRIYKGLARIAGGKGLKDAEENYWRAVLKLEPNDQEALATLTIITQPQIAQTTNTIVDGKTTNPLPTLQTTKPQLEDLYLAAAVAAFRDGISLYDTGETYQARLLFIEATELDEGFKEAWVWLGRTRFEQESYVLASVAFERALELDPHDGDIKASLAQARARQ